ncbi:GntR family transcriptional regulator [Desulfovibrio sp. JC010]|uniref:GntR family transcriptional regulator n=1 Tax=Desulfovibrio sp. JC010 TaxID=2593641 RepID=UPI0013D6EE09|nr:GntR family transcriptional regulator [Desulfovibrio sp. JC010]NDV25609.1 GntR family transcriptional regulator [Desulfovibrio sp. JC010]
MEKTRYYQIVQEQILKRLASGELKPGDKLPSERTLCTELSLNRNTIRHALLKLQRDGKIFRLERKGWYVNPIRMVYNPANHVNFAQLAASQGRKAKWTTEDNGIITIDEDMETYTSEGFAAGAEVYSMENTFFIDGQKVARTLNYLNADKLEGIVPKTAERAMTQVVEQDYGLQLKQRNLLIRPQLLPRDVTSQLGITHGSPGIYVRRIKTDGRETVLTVEHEYWRFDAIELRVDQV